MLLVLELDVADLAATRFAISPLNETLRAVQLLGGQQTPTVNAPWVRWARRELSWRPLRLPRLWPLVINGLTTHPEFLGPAPQVRTPELGAELARLRATPAAAVRASLRRVWEGCPWPESARELDARPRESLAELADELAECHDRLIAPHWERIRPVLEADIAYRAGLLAGGGARSLFSDLHPDLRWSGGTLTLTDNDQGPSPFKIMLGPDGVVLMPSVFNWPEVSLSLATSTQTVMLYPARGTATVWEGTVWEGTVREGGAQDGGAQDGGREEAAEALLGAPRVRLLDALRSPATTTALARRLGVTPSAVSQHLAVLHRGGLVDKRRSGRVVLYQTTELGLALLRGGLAASGVDTMSGTSAS
jgi:DNA-binding transcriptional ArsR family regulator